MRRLSSKGVTLYCFSPLVMLLTFLVEILLALYVVSRYKINKSIKLIVSLLLCLAIFQLAEYMICEGDPAAANLWAKAGFIAITLLPPLGLHLVSSISKGVRASFVAVAYSMAGALSLYFIFSSSVLSSVCGGNYILFSIPQPLNALNGLYYHGVILVSIIIAVRKIKSSNQKAVRSALKWYLLGVFGFLLPTAIVTNLIRRDALNNVPSIMCGFAVIFAVILALQIAPKVSKKISSNK